MGRGDGRRVAVGGKAGAAMNVSFFALWRWEVRALARRPLLWLMLALLGLAFAWGARSGTQLHRAQAVAQAATQAGDAAWLRDLRERAQRNAHSAAEPLPYWQDPTDVAGFSRYLLRVHAIKPHLPLSPLAVGGSDLWPSRLPLKLETPFAIEPAYDFEPPRALAQGRFDLGFAIVVLLPLVLVLLVGLLATFERDHGILRMIAVQSVGPRTWLSARVAAIATWTLPATALLLTMALLVASVPISSAWPEFVAALALVCAYCVFWLALAFAVTAAWPSAAGAIGTLVASWALLCVGAPLLLSCASEAVAPAPSRVAYIDAQRRNTDAIEAERDRILASAFRSRADLAQRTDRIGTLDYATRLTFLTPVLESRLQLWQQRFDAARIARERHASLAGYAIPALGMESALSALAGTDAARQHHFEQQTRVFQHRLRRFFYDRVQAQIAAPTPRPPGSYARMNFGEHAAIPAFAMSESPSSARVRATAPVIAWLLALGGVLILLAGVRLRRWPSEL